MAQRGEAAGFDDRARLGGGVDVRDHHALRAAVEDAGGVVRVVRGYARDRGDAEAERGDADAGGGFQRGGVVLQVDVERVEAAGGGDHRDVRGAELVDAETQHEFVGGELLFGEVGADLGGHGRGSFLAVMDGAVQAWGDDRMDRPRRYRPSRTTGLLSVPMPLISTSIRSPCFMLAVAPSVPIQMTSPGYSVRQLVIATR